MVKKLDGYDSILDKLNAHDSSLAEKVTSANITNIRDNSGTFEYSMDNTTWKKIQGDSMHIDVTNPPAPLVAAKGDGITDDSPLFEALRTNGYDVFVPEGVYATSKTLVSDYRSRITGASVFKTRFVPTDTFPTGQPVIHMESGDSRFDRLGGHFSIGTAVGDYTVGKYNADGILLTGCLYSIDHIHVSGMNRAYVLDTTNTYLVTLEHCSAAYNNEVLVAPAPVSNANENISFINCMFYNNVDGISNNGFELLFTNCSLDYCSGSMLKYNDGQMSFVNCHFEWGTTAPLLNPYGGATSLKYGAVIFTNCGFFKANSGGSWDRITKSVLLSSLFTSGSIYVNHCWSQDTNGNVYTVDENLLIDAPTGIPTLSTTYQNTKGVPLHMYLQVVMNPTSSVNASFTPFVWEAGADMESLGQEIVQAGNPQNNQRLIHVIVPSGWFYQFQGTNVTISGVKYRPN